MKIPYDLADALQCQLAEYLPIDNPHPNDIFYGFADKSRDVRAQWQVTVDMIYRLLISNLLRLWPDSILGEPKDSQFPHNALRFCEALAQIDPDGPEAIKSHSDEYGLPWYGFDLCMTDTTHHLLAKHGFVWSKDANTPFNQAFIEDIEALFEAYCVAWSDKPLIPIRAESAN